MMVEGKPNPDFILERIVFRSYTLVYTDTGNIMNRIIIPSTALNKSSNNEGHYLMSLYNGNKLHSYEWTELRIENYVIKQVKELSTDEESH